MVGLRSGKLATTLFQKAHLAAVWRTDQRKQLWKWGVLLLVREFTDTWTERWLWGSEIR